MVERGLDPGKIISELRAAGAGPMLDVAINPEDAPRQRELTGDIDGVYYSLGLHPGSTGRADWAEALELIRAGLATGGYRAVGETGLDWYRMYAPRERQRELFAAHLELADHHALPVIVHNRDADDDCLELIRAVHPHAGGVMHCFSSAPEWVKRFLDAGMYISFAGNLTFKSAANLREAVALVPADRLLLETDAPFLAPHPHRGQPNHPGLLVHTLEVAAEMRGTTPDALAERTAENLSCLLRLG
jgi:TatD DNase family protein